MRLTPGTRLGPYEIVAQIGVGGMGEVYQATDTNLARKVALKVLPTAVASDPERLARFEREAKTLAALNHPNIAQIYGFERAEDIRALVLEFVDGPTLADRIVEGPLPLNEALPIARQIADALETAHEHGIVHRDLKPANIKLRPDGTVKVLDFGLAKLVEAGGATGASGIAAQSMSPTITSPALMTGGGVILGTAAYMSPEQARGKPVDKRTDIWAFGCVLYETLTGRRPFEGGDVTATLARVLEREADLTLLPADTPPAVRRLLRRCLQKGRRERLADIADARLELDAVGSDESDRTTTSHPARRWAWLMALTGVGAGMIAGALLMSAADRRETVAGPSPILRASIDLPPDAPLALGSDIPAVGYNSPVVAVAPDGGTLTYVARTAAGRVLYVHDMASGETRPLPGTNGAIHPFYSPDSQWIGFLTDQHVKKVAVAGGAAFSLSEADRPVLAWWPRADQIYFTEHEATQLTRIPSDGGRREIVARPGELGILSFSDLLPDGEHVLGITRPSIGLDFASIVRVNLRTKATEVLARSGYAARYVSGGYLLFARAGNLMAVRYDEVRGKTIGDPVTLAADVGMESLFGMLHAASSPTGMAAYAAGGDLSVGKLAWVGRDGSVDYLDIPERVYGVVDLAPDGERIAVHVADVTDYVWIWDPARREGRRVTSERAAGFPLWSPDGRRIAASTLNEGEALVHDVERSGATTATRMLGGRGRTPRSWSRDGKLIAFSGSNRIEFVPVDGGAPIQGGNGSFNAFSPDGRWIAVQSAEIFVKSYPDGELVGQVSTSGGIEPLWLPSGDFYYRNGHRWFHTRITTNPEPRWDPPRAVFDAEFIDTPGTSYDVSPDGTKLLVAKRSRPIPGDRIDLVINWFGAVPR